MKLYTYLGFFIIIAVSACSHNQKNIYSKKTNSLSERSISSAEEGCYTVGNNRFSKGSIVGGSVCVEYGYDGWFTNFEITVRDEHLGAIIKLFQNDNGQCNLKFDEISLESNGNYKTKLSFNRMMRTSLASNFADNCIDLAKEIDSTFILKTGFLLP